MVPHMTLRAFVYGLFLSLIFMIAGGISSTISDFQYQYNPANQITQIAETANSRNFLYDTVDRLTSATYTAQPNESYSYDAIGNRTSSHLSSTYSYQPFNRLVTTSTASYAFDNNGNMTKRTDASGSWQYYWDAENRLVRAVKPGLGPISYRTIVYRYDALGRRVTRLAKRGGTTNFTYDGQDVVLDANSNGSTTTYVNGPGIDNKLKQTSSVSGTHYYFQDHQGSTRALTDSSGNVATQITYDSFGNTSPNALTRFGYIGRELDPDTGLMYYRARWYDPQLGRFISEDPIGFEGGDVNLFGYVRNNPIKLVDPSGLRRCNPYLGALVGGAAGGVLVGGAGAGIGAIVGAVVGGGVGSFAGVPGTVIVGGGGLAGGAVIGGFIGSAVGVGVGIGIGYDYCSSDDDAPTCDKSKDNVREFPQTRPYPPPPPTRPKDKDDCYDRLIDCLRFAGTDSVRSEKCREAWEECMEDLKK